VHGEPVKESFPIGTVDIDQRMRISVSREKATKADGVRRASLPKNNRSHSIILEQGGTAQDESPHHHLADVGAADEQRAKMRCVERIRDAALGPRARRAERRLLA